MQRTQLKEVVNWLKSLDNLIETQMCQSPEFFRPFHFATLALVMRAKGAAKIGLPNHLIGYATRMKLWEAIGIAPPKKTFQENNPIARFHPLERLLTLDDVGECSKKLASIADHARLDKASQNSLDIAIAELLENCFSHGKAVDGLHGVACAQFWPRGRLAQIAIVDSGIGMRKSFDDAETEEVRKRAADSNCCELATEFGITTKPTKHAGYGLALARQLMEKNNGTLLVCSDNEWFMGNGSYFEKGKMDTSWSGTLVIVEFNTDRPLSTKAVYESWPPVRGYSNDDFDF